VSRQTKAREDLPATVRDLFWDVDSRALRWDRDRDLILGRVLAAGPWDTVLWLRQRLGDEALRDWILRHRGRGLSPRQLRFWQLILDLPSRQVDQWLRGPERAVWDHRVRP